MRGIVDRGPLQYTVPYNDHKEFMDPADVRLLLQKLNLDLPFCGI